MKTEQCVLPVKCAECGVTFDLWYDLLAREGEVFDSGSLREKYGDEQHLCWECRKAKNVLLREKEVMENELDSVLESEELTLAWE